MNIKSVYIENFRGYKSRQRIDISNLTAFVGQNDVGKSTILEALDIFFNEGKGVVGIDSNDVNKEAQQNEGKVDVLIGVVFNNLPAEICIDSTNTTTLEDEYLLDDQHCLTVFKRYPNGSSKYKASIYAYHPTFPDCCDLLQMSVSELRKISEGLNCEHHIKASMRKAIRNQYSDSLACEMREIDMTKEDAKSIWEQLKKYMPVYTLFQADRENADKDKEVQDPLKEAVKIIMSSPDIQSKCQEIHDAVIRQLQAVSDRTLQKIQEMNPELSNTLHPKLPAACDLKWTDVFKNVSITGDNDIPINKRGSGVKRLVLLNFFRAEAEQVQERMSAPGIIYAIEEPETAQHFNHQVMLIKSLLHLASQDTIQVLITTHSSIVLKQLLFDHVRLVRNTEAGKVVEKVQEAQLNYPSLNEIAFVAFGEVSEEYHNELFGFIEAEQLLNEFKAGKETFLYKRKGKNDKIVNSQLIQSEIIRHQIHHPDNQLNTRFTKEELLHSIEEMRDFISKQKAAI